MKKITEKEYLLFAQEIEEKEYKQFKIQFNNHRTPYEFSQGFLQELSGRIVAFQSQNQMNQIIPVVDRIFESNKSLTFFKAIQQYCKQENKNLKNISNLLAEYKGMVDTYSKIRKENPIITEDKNENKFSAKNEDVKENESSINKEFSGARQVLAMHFIFQYMQVNKNEIDDSVKAIFIQFLTGKNYKNIYDLVRSPFSTKTKKFRLKDLQYIRTYFEKLGLSEIVKAINNELDKPL